MSGVDVLAVLHDLARFVNSQTESCDEGANDLLAPVDAAKKTVEEMIATLRYVASFDGQGMSAAHYAVVAKRARAALARCGGAA